MSVLSVHHLSKSYNKRAVVSDVSLSLQSGEIVGLIGPNGAGKTTSFHMIIGLVACDSGAVYLDGQDITGLSIDRRAQRGLGYLPQETSIFRKLTVAENIMAILELQRHLDCATMKHKLVDLLAEFNITHLADSLGMVLSGGERRRVEIARALATEPSFLLLDEPFAGVDPLSISDIKRLIKQLIQRKIGVLITDHNVRDTLRTCDRTYIVNNGRIIAEGTVEQIIENEQVRAVYLGKEFSL